MCREDNLCYIYTVNWDACQYRIIRLQVIGNSAQTGWNNIITVTLTFPNEEMASKSTPFSESKAGSYFAVHRRDDIVDLEALIALSNSIAQSRGTSLDVSWTRQSWCNQCWFSCSIWLCLSTYVGLFSWLPGGYNSFKSNMFTAPNTMELACSNLVHPNDSDLVICTSHNQSLFPGSLPGIWDVLFHFCQSGPFHEPVFIEGLRVSF